MRRYVFVSMRMLEASAPRARGNLARAVRGRTCVLGCRASGPTAVVIGGLRVISVLDGELQQLCRFTRGQTRQGRSLAPLLAPATAVRRSAGMVRRTRRGTAARIAVSPV